MEPAGTEKLSALDSLVIEGEELYFRDQFDSARLLWRDLLPQVAGTATEPRVLTWLGLAAWRQGDYSEARQMGERALALKQSLGLDEEIAKSYNALGLLAWNEGRLGDASRLYQRAMNAARSQGDMEGVAKAASNLGLIQTDLGQFRAARASFRFAHAAARDLGDVRIEGVALTNLGMLDIWSGDPLSAVPSLREAQRLYRQIGYGTGELNALGQLGTAYLGMGEFRRAFTMLDSALMLARARGLRQEEASNLELLADLYREAGDYARALQSYEDARKINDELGLPIESGNILRSEAMLQRSLRHLERAQSNAEKARQLHHASEASVHEMEDLLLLAEISAEMGDRDAAATYLAAAAERAEELGTRGSRILVALARARIASGSSQRPEEVLVTFEEIEEDLARMPAGMQWEVHSLRSRAFAALGRSDSAVAEGRRAVSAIERVRGSLGSGMLRTRYTSMRADVYANLVLLLLSQGNVEEAFVVADAARSRALLEHLSATRKGVRIAPALGSLIGGDELLQRIDALIARLSELEELSPPERGIVRAAEDDLARQLSEAQRRYEALLVHVAERDTAASALLGMHRTRVEDVRSALGRREALVEFLVGAERVLVFVITREEIRVFESPLAARDLVNRIRLARELISRPDHRADEVAPVYEALYSGLLSPMIGSGVLDGIRDLILVPHGPLTYLPFAALRDPATGRVLADRFTLRFLPSAGSFAAIRTMNRSRAPNLRPVVFAPFPDRLPATGREARAFRRTQNGSLARLGRRATEGALRSALSRGAMVHVATHGVMNAKSPMFSRLELASGSSGESTDDGRLEVHEVLELQSGSPLVFLSGCETGLGGAWRTDFERGEDYATLAQAFLYAGVENVVATLWRIEDEGAAAFAGRFYHHLREASPTEALSRAQRDLRQSGRWSHPYYWAPYTLAGGGSRAPDE